MSKSSQSAPSPEWRQFLTGVAGLAVAAAASPLLLHSRRAFAAEQQMTLVSWGGAYRQAIEESVVKPFTKETGIQVTIVDSPGERRLWDDGDVELQCHQRRWQAGFHR